VFGQSSQTAFGQSNKPPSVFGANPAAASPSVFGQSQQSLFRAYFEMIHLCRPVGHGIWSETCLWVCLFVCLLLRNNQDLADQVCSSNSPGRRIRQLSTTGT
jgi:hypothetical protein